MTTETRTALRRLLRQCAWGMLAGLTGAEKVRMRRTRPLGHVLESHGLPNGAVAKNLPVNSGGAGDAGLILDGEDPLEEETVTHCSVLARESPWTEEPGRQQSMGLQRVGHNCATVRAHTHTHTQRHTHTHISESGKS